MIDNVERTVKRARLIAFYLPQFHPIPENDRWWGNGFTEWNNVARARALFRGHYQPRLPADLGFYDLRVPETREAQAQMALDHGVEGFCYWHYWFSGKRMLERPFEEMLRAGHPKIPFCVAWANVHWTGGWVGHPEKTLIEQTYSVDDHRLHFRYLLPAFSDDRYLKVDGKPLFYVQRPRSIPGVRDFVDLWREAANEAGLKGLHFVGNDLDAQSMKDLGFDAFSCHYPYWVRLARGTKVQRIYRRFLNKPAVLSYQRAMKDFRENYQRSSDHYPLLVPNWDNTPRMGWRGLVLQGSTPEAFRQVARKVFDSVEQKPIDRRIVFIKSWNEWAEGNYLEPDQRFGKDYLSVLRAEVWPGSDLRTNAAGSRA